MIVEDIASLAQRKAKCSMIIWGLAYLFLFPFLFFFFAPFVGAHSINASFMNKLTDLIDLLPIFTMPLSLLLMWISYSKKHYKIVRFCWVVPVLFYAATLLMHVILDLM